MTQPIAQVFDARRRDSEMGGWPLVDVPARAPRRERFHATHGLKHGAVLR